MNINETPKLSETYCGMCHFHIKELYSVIFLGKPICVECNENLKEYFSNFCKSQKS